MGRDPREEHLMIVEVETTSPKLGTVTTGTRCQTGGSILIMQETLLTSPEQLRFGTEDARRATDKLFAAYGDELRELRR